MAWGVGVVGGVEVRCQLWLGGGGGIRKRERRRKKKKIKGKVSRDCVGPLKDCHNNVLFLTPFKKPPFLYLKVLGI